METTVQTFTIGKAAERADVGIDTVRFYERKGLLPKPERTTSGYRLYTAEAVERLIFIRRAKSLGFSLDEVADLIRLNAGKGTRSGVKKLAENRLGELDRKIRDLTVIRDALASLVRQCSGQGSIKGCPIIEGVLSSERHCHKSGV